VAIIQSNVRTERECFAQFVPYSLDIIYEDATRGFSVATPAAWNSLPCGIRDSSSTHGLHSVAFLKLTAAGKQAFGSPYRLRQMLQVRTVHSKDRFTYLLSYTAAVSVVP